MIPPARATCGSRSAATPTRWATLSREGSCGSSRRTGRHRSRSGESGRRQLADWIASGDNPLTARVAVNRIWQRLFGEGIVRSVDYFGRRGETPTHPELLDALALRFVADGWSQKRLIRSLVLSRAYAHEQRARQPVGRGRSRQSPVVADESPPARRGIAARRDAGRRGNAHRCAAAGPACRWSIRRTPAGLKKGDVNPPSFRLARFRPEQEFVRTVYLPIIRSGPQAGPAEVRNVFDFTQPGEFAGQRAVTTVPTQALFLMNAKFLKRRALELARSDDDRLGRSSAARRPLAPCAEPTDHGRGAG